MGGEDAMQGQTEAMFKVLADAQKWMWGSWFELIKNAPGPAPFYAGALDQWRELARQGLKGWTDEADQVIKDTAERLLTTQDAVMRFLELSVTAWKVMVPKIEAGEDWQTTLHKYTDQLRHQFLQFPQGMARAAQDTDELWRLYLEQWQKVLQPWIESLRRAPWRLGQAATGDAPALLELTNLYWDAYERTFGRLLESPSMGHTRELTEDLLKGFNAWLESRRASFEYQVFLAEGWSRAFEQFMRTLVSKTEKGQPVQDLRQLLYLWIDVIEDIFTTLFRSEDYIQRQSRLVNTVMTYKLIERDLVEAFLKTSHVPSRSELDEAYRRIYELRREVKDLKKALQELKIQSGNQPSKISEGDGSRAVEPAGPTSVFKATNEQPS
jgi:class III poly(R)-hydroxyalkanoic acid synthase PhaE subunit